MVVLVRVRGGGSTGASGMGKNWKSRVGRGGILLGELKLMDLKLAGCSVNGDPFANWESRISRWPLCRYYRAEIP